MNEKETTDQIVTQPVKTQAGALTYGMVKAWAEWLDEMNEDLFGAERWL